MTKCPCGKGFIRVGMKRDIYQERYVVLLCDFSGEDFMWCRYTQMHPDKNLASAERDLIQERKRNMTRDLNLANKDDLERYFS